MISRLVWQEQDSETKETEFSGLMTITVNAVCDKSLTSLEANHPHVVGLFNLSLIYSLQRIGDEGTCRVRVDPSGWGMLTLKASLARVLFFFDPATPIRASTSALRSFKMPTQSTLWKEHMVEEYITNIS